jgi:AcrR family transcriptional regulator
MTREQGGNDQRPRTGRARSKALDDAIADASMRLLLESGPTGLTVEGVAREVGCAKASIYRRFGSREGLVLAAASTLFGSLLRERPANLEDMIVRFWAAATEQEALVPVVSLLMAEAARGTDLGTMSVEKILRPMRAVDIEDLSQAIARGEVRGDVGPDLLLDVIAGTILFRAARRGGPEPDLPARLMRLLTVEGRPGPGR